MLSLHYSVLERNHSGDDWIKDHIHKCVTLNEIHADYYVSGQPQSHGKFYLEVSFACWNLSMLHPLPVWCGKEEEGKNNPDIFPEEGMREKEQHSTYQKDGSANQGFSYGYSFWSLFMGEKKKKKSLVNKLLLQFTCGTRRPTIWTCIKHAGLALQGHTVKKCKCVRVSQCRACLHMNKS